MSIRRRLLDLESFHPGLSLQQISTLAVRIQIMSGWKMLVVQGPKGVIGTELI